MNSVALPTPPDQRQGRLTLALIVGLLALPFVIAAALYFGGWHPSRVTHHGHLLTPPRPLPTEILRSTEKNAEKWQLLLHVRGPCAADCQRRLDEMRRVHVALYKNMGRLGRALLTEQADDPALPGVRASQPDLMLLSASPDTLADIADPLLLVDPQGRIIMTYPPDASPQGLRADLDRLLKYAG
jgi:hypothetical protein